MNARPMSSARSIQPMVVWSRSVCSIRGQLSRIRHGGTGGASLAIVEVRRLGQLRVPRQIVWAVDAFEPPESPLIRASAAWITGLIRDFGTRVEPVYVLNPAELNLTSEFSVPWVNR